MEQKILELKQIILQEFDRCQPKWWSYSLQVKVEDAVSFSEIEEAFVGSEAYLSDFLWFYFRKTIN